MSNHLIETEYDFLYVQREYSAKLQRYIYSPSFIVDPELKDLMTRAQDFYALINHKTGLWVTDKLKANKLIDDAMRKAVVKDAGSSMEDPEHGPIIRFLRNTDNHMLDKWYKFCKFQMGDHYETLNQKIIFSNTEVKQEDYSSYRLPYPIQEEPTPYFDKLVNTLYLPDESAKFMYLIGCIIAGEQSKVQKLFVFYGLPGSGKSTIINKVIVNTVFGGARSPYTTKFTAGLLANKSDFGTSFLFSDAVLAFDDDADLSRIEDNTVLNLIVSHEAVLANKKFSPTFNVYPNLFLVCGTNEPIQLSPNSGLNRRLIDIRQTGEHLPPEEYDDCIDHLKFERSGIAYKCLQLYKTRGKNYYNKYTPEDMLSKTSPFHNFVKDNFVQLREGISLANAYKYYTDYCEETKLKSTMSRYKFRDSLKLYFDEYTNEIDGGGKAFFSGFKYEKIGLKRPETYKKPEEKKSESKEDPLFSWLKFNETKSLFDEVYADMPAQYSKSDGSPTDYWANVKTTLGDLDSKREHYVKVPENLIVIDFDLKDDNNEKSFVKNYEAARKLPRTYAELSKSGAGIHLHYIYTGGDPSSLSTLYGDNIEVKVFKGNSALRRKLSYCNDIPIAEISSGLPLKEAKKKMVDWDGWKNENVITSMICRNLDKEYHGHTKPSIDYIDYILDQAYESGMSYDLRKLYQPVYDFALRSSHKSEYCTDKVAHMHFCSDDVLEREKQNEEKEIETTDSYDNAPIVIFDIESYPEDKGKNMEALLVVCWKYLGKDKTVVTMINPTPKEVRDLFRFRLVGFNNRDYDNHILYARSQGYSVAECNRLSQRIINSDNPEEKRRAKFMEAYGLAYTDIYDFAAASNKQSLKKWEIELGIHHQEMGIPWDQAVPKEMWPKVAEYCTNDVIATEAVWNHLQPDFMAREILAELTDMKVCNTTNQLTTKLLTEGIQDPQQYYIYTHLADMFPGYEFDPKGIDRSRYKEDVKIVSGKSIYKGIDPGEGGRKIGYPGMYKNIGLFDVASMHPSSMIKLQIFGKEITKRLENLVKGRIAIKHKDYELAISLLGEKVRKYLTGDEATLKRNAKALANALKTAINSVYGLTSASFNNKLRDPRNVDNIVAKYGALFMVDLEEELTNMGYKVVHVSTDSIKVADVDVAAWNYIYKRGQEMGFTFEWEAVYEKMTLVNDAVYIAKFMEPDRCKALYNFIPEDNSDAMEKGLLWSPTGKQFQIPYVFKTLFSHEEIIFKDMCESFSVSDGGTIYLDKNEDLPDVTELEKSLKKLTKLINDYLRIDYIPTKSVVKFENDLRELLGVPNDVSRETLKEVLEKEIAKGHDYRFIGRVGQFTPILPGHGGGALNRYDGARYTSVSGSKGYRWLESETMTDDDKNYIDKSYYRKLVDDAKNAIEEFGDFEWFVSDSNEPAPNFMNKPE